MWEEGEGSVGGLAACVVAWSLDFFFIFYGRGAGLDACLLDGFVD